ncbi:MAG: tRNA pseudouridine(55) synthase TruB [Gammaproteobacteria bacterium]
MGKRRRGRDVSGILVLDKPQGMSSNEAVQKAKHLFNARKVGHTGSLDPLATGVLPLCFGEATKFSQYLLSSDTKYWVKIKLGVATDSGDADGQVVRTAPVEGITAERVEDALRFFRGEIDQVPSMFSAIKHRGQPLYKLARQGIEIEREARRVTVYSNRLLAVEGESLTLAIHCSKGTYVRTIAEELGEILGCGAHVIALRRTAAGPYDEEDLVTFEELAAAREKGSLDPFLLPVASAVREWPEVRLTDNTAYYLRQGQPVIVPHAPTSGWVRLSEVVADKSTKFIGVGEILDDGRVAPRRLVVEHVK